MSLPKMLRVQGVGTKAQAERNRLIKKVVVLLLVIIMSALFCVWSRIGVVQVGYEITKIQEEAVGLKKQVDHLRVEVERLKSPGRLQKVAAEFLNMHPPSGKEIVFVKKN